MPILPELVDWAKDNPIDPVSLQPAILDPGSTLKADGFPQQYVLPRQDINFLHNNSAQWNKLFNASTKDYIAGFNISNSFAQVSTGSWLDITHGACTTKDKAWVINTLLDPGFPADVMRKWIIKASTTTWVKGNDEPGLSPGVGGVFNNTWYYPFVVVLNDGDIDIVYDDNTAGGNIISDFSTTSIRRIGAVFYFGSDQIRIFRSMGNHFFVPGGLNVQFNGSDAQLKTIDLSQSLPVGIDIIALINMSIDATFLVTPTTISFSLLPKFKTQNVTAVTVSTTNIHNSYGDIHIPIVSAITGLVEVNVASSVTITSGDVQVFLNVSGYIDNRGSDWLQGPAIGTSDNFFDI